MWHRMLAASVVCAACCLADLTPLAATVVVPLDLDQLVAGADIIAIGRVAHTIERRATRGGAETSVSMGALTLLKGTAAGALEFAVPGGRVGRFRTVVPGLPEVRQGDEFVVFLRAAPDGLTLVGFFQGLVPVLRNPATGDATVMAPPADSTVDRRITRGDPARRPESLPAFARRIQGLVERDREARAPDRTGARRRHDGAAW